MASLNANFTDSPSNGNSPLDVQFHDSSKGAPVDWLWDFGDSTGSSEQNPAHVFVNTTPGTTKTFTVSLRILDADKNVSNVEGIIKVNGPALPDPTTNDSGTAWWAILLVVLVILIFIIVMVYFVIWPWWNNGRVLQSPRRFV